MITTILFDLDGTLAPFLQDEFIEAYFAALTARLKPMGYDPQALIDALWKGTADMIANDGGATNRQKFWERFTSLLGIQALGLEPILEDFYTQDFDQVRTVLRERPDHGPLLRSLREKGYTLVLATNPIFPRAAVETRLRWVGLTAEDSACITTYENSRRCKPNPDYYRDILQQINVQPSDCLMIGNNPVDDMSAAQAGLNVFLVTDCLENPKGLPIAPYPNGTFDALRQRLENAPRIA